MIRADERAVALEDRAFVPGRHWLGPPRKHDLCRGFILSPKRLQRRGESDGTRACLGWVLREKCHNLVRAASIRSRTLAPPPEKIEPRPVRVTGEEGDGIVERPIACAKLVPEND